MRTIAVIGAGPAGLHAAEVAAEAGAKVSVFDAKPSSGRKFLIAGKSGLNLTNDEDWNSFLQNYSGNNLPLPLWTEILNAFDNQELRKWANSLGVETFVASSGKVFPTEMKAGSLLKRWIDKLRTNLGVSFYYNHKCYDLISIEGGVEVSFSCPNGDVTQQFDTVVIALGGGSWASTGSDGNWVELLSNKGISVTPLTAANSGWEVLWKPSLLEIAEGLPLKNLAVSAGNSVAMGELVITKYGLEGGPIYKLGPAIKSLPFPEICIDFKPAHTIDQLIKKMESAKNNLVSEAKNRWKLSPGCYALFEDRHTESKKITVTDLAESIKNFPISLTKTRPIDEAISSAGGIQWSEIDHNLMLKKMPNVYCAGEMLDWEAPTGGYLLQACFATGNWAGKSCVGLIKTI